MLFTYSNRVSVAYYTYRVQICQQSLSYIYPFSSSVHSYPLLSFKMKSIPVLFSLYLSVLASNVFDLLPENFDSTVNAGKPALVEL